MPPHWHSRLGFLILSILPPHVLAAWGTVTLTPLQPTPVAGHSATLIRTDGNRALACVVGGVTGGNIPTSQIAFLDLSVPSPTWWTLPFNDTVVPPIAGHTAHVIHPMKDGKFDMSDPPFVMLLYGVTSWNPRKYFSISDGKTDVSIAEMDLASDRASDVVDGFNTGSTAPIQRVRHSSAVQYSQWTLYLYGGVVGGSEDNISQELWSMNMNSKLWTRMPDPPDNDPPPTAESGASMLLVQNERYLLICFGIHRRPTNGCSLFDTVNNVWNATSIDSGSAEPAPRASATLTHLKLGSSEFALLFAGGNYGDGTAYNDLWALDLSKLPALCWRPIILCENSSVPAARFDHSMIALSDNYFFMWGGHSSLYEQPDGTVHFLEVRLSEDGTLHGTWSLNYEIPDVIIVDSGYKVSTGTQTERAPVISRGPDSTRNGNRGGEANGAASSTFPTPTFANPHGTITPSATPSGDPNRATSNSLGVVLLAALGVILGVMLFRFWKTFKKEPGDRFVLAFEKAMVYSSCWQFSWCWLTRKRRPQLENRTSQICPQSSGTQITMSLGRRSSATVINVMTSSGQRSGARNAGSVAVHREPTITSGTTCARSLRSDRADERRSQFFEDFENEEELSKDRSQPGLVPGTSIQSGALLLGPVPTVSEDFSEVIDVWRGYDSAEPHTLFQGQSSQTSNHGQILFGVQEFSPEHPLGFDSVSVRDSGGLSWFPRGGELAGSDNQDYQALPLFRTNTGHSGFPHIDVARTHSRHSLLTTPVEMVRSSSSQTYHSMVELIPVCHSPVELIPVCSSPTELIVPVIHYSDDTSSDGQKLSLHRSEYERTPPLLTDPSFRNTRSRTGKSRKRPQQMPRAIWTTGENGAPRLIRSVSQPTDGTVSPNEYFTFSRAEGGDDIEVAMPFTPVPTVRFNLPNNPPASSTSLPPGDVWVPTNADLPPRIPRARTSDGRPPSPLIAHPSMRTSFQCGNGSTPRGIIQTRRSGEYIEPPPAVFEWPVAPIVVPVTYVDAEEYGVIVTAAIGGASSVPTPASFRWRSTGAIRRGSVPDLASSTVQSGSLDAGREEEEVPQF